MTSESLDDVPVRVPDDEQPGATCPYCDRPFPTEHGRDLHLGEHHEDLATETELDAYEHARDEESDELFVYHFKVVVALGVVWALVILLYMVALGSGLI